MEERIYNAALAGLLHDIGKFAQRADVGASRIWDQQAESDFKYRHALLTADFIEKYTPEKWSRVVKNLAANHHRPTNVDEKLIRLADQLSAGERSRDTEGGKDDRTIHPRQLRSIFCSLATKSSTGKIKRTPEDLYLPLKPQSLDKQVIFPDKEQDEPMVWAAYAQMWDQFCGEASELNDAHHKNGSLPIYLENLMMLVQRFTWCIPSAYFGAIPDISLYDHGRMTAALAAILVSSNLSQKVLDNLCQAPDKSGESVALLVGGDISGIQDFIYTITSSGATSALRGRSFYLQLLNEAVARFVLNRLELPITNLIYAGGGNFYLLARPSDQDRLLKIQYEISQVLFRHHRGELYVALNSISLRGVDFYNGRISHDWQILVDGLQTVKQRRFSELEKELGYVFQPQGHGGDQDKQCQVCGGEHPGTDVIEGVRKCPPCLSFESLGKELRRANYLMLEYIESEIQPRWDSQLAPGGWEDILKEFGLKVSLLKDFREVDLTNATPRLFLALGDENLANLHPASCIAVGRRWMVNVTPTITDTEISRLQAMGVSELPKADSIKPFHAMEAQAQGISRLGALRMDVDNLGKLFSEGLGQQATLSRVAALSFMISLYFEGWVAFLASQRNIQGQGDPEKGERLYAIYSGGDDLLFVGAWDEIIELAREIRRDLTPYAANHPGITASAGIVLVGGKYPMAQAARDTGRAEERAKSLKWWDSQGLEHRKDAITFLGQSLPWQKFGLGECQAPGLENAHGLMHLLKELVEKKGANKALLHKLVQLHKRQQDAIQAQLEAGKDKKRAGRPQTLWGPWQWLGFYTLTRLAHQTRNEAIDELRKQLKADDFRSMEWAGLAARWAEIITR